MNNTFKTLTLDQQWRIVFQSIINKLPHSNCAFSRLFKEDAWWDQFLVDAKEIHARRRNTVNAVRSWFTSLGREPKIEELFGISKEQLGSLETGQRSITPADVRLVMHVIDTTLFSSTFYGWLDFFFPFFL